MVKIQTMKCKIHFCASFVFPPFTNGYVQRLSRLKSLNNYWMDCDELWFRRS